MNIIDIFYFADNRTIFLVNEKEFDEVFLKKGHSWGVYVEDILIDKITNLTRMIPLNPTKNLDKISLETNCLLTNLPKLDLTDKVVNLVIESID